MLLKVKQKIVIKCRKILAKTKACNRVFDTKPYSKKISTQDNLLGGGSVALGVGLNSRAAIGKMSSWAAAHLKPQRVFQYSCKLTQFLFLVIKGGCSK